MRDPHSCLVALLVSAIVACDWGAKETDAVPEGTRRLIEHLEASAETLYDEERATLLVSMLRDGVVSLSDEHVAELLAEKDSDFDRTTLAIATTLAEQTGLDENSDDPWVRLFSTRAHDHALRGRWYITPFDGLALPPAAAPAHRLVHVLLLSRSGWGNATKLKNTLSKLADEGHPRGMARYGDFLADGRFGCKNLPAARWWYERAAEEGDALGRAELGYFLIQDQSDPARGMRLLEQAADAGLARAMYILAFVHENGILGKKDPEKASQWRAKSAASGYLLARIDEFLEQNGPPDSPNSLQATKFGEYCRDAGYEDKFFYRTAEAFQYGFILPNSEKKAFAFYREAADLGSGAAGFKLFFAYYNGEGTTVDKVKAFATLEEAARRGSADAYGQLAYYDRYRPGRPKSPVEAWLASMARSAIDDLKGGDVVLDHAYAADYIAHYEERTAGGAAERERAADAPVCEARVTPAAKAQADAFLSRLATADLPEEKQAALDTSWRKMNFIPDTMSGHITLFESMCPTDVPGIFGYKRRSCVMKNTKEGGVIKDEYVLVSFEDRSTGKWKAFDFRKLDAADIESEIRGAAEDLSDVKLAAEQFNYRRYAYWLMMGGRMVAAREAIYKAIEINASDPRERFSEAQAVETLRMIDSIVGTSSASRSQTPASAAASAGSAGKTAEAQERPADIGEGAAARVGSRLSKCRGDQPGRIRRAAFHRPGAGSGLTRSDPSRPDRGPPRPGRSASEGQRLGR